MNIDMYSIVRNMFAPIISVIMSIFWTAVFIAVALLIAFVVGFFVSVRLNPFRFNVSALPDLSIRFPPYKLLRWVLYDFLTRKNRNKTFSAYGFTIFVGRQGSGKTVSMINYLCKMKQKYPNCIIVTNFSFALANHRMTDWRDLLEIRNGTDGVIFAIDEIHSEYSAASWKDFPENLLSEISQQRKQRIKIVATAQVFSRVAKPLREQAFSVTVCETYLSRFTLNREYDAAEYSTTSDNIYQVKKKIRPLWKSRFIQSNELRSSYDTYEKIERMKQIEFIPRNER